ncbi:MAG: thioredoxin domain-containing protein [Actinomycetota bacterium]
MTYDSSGDTGLSRNQRREGAREKARALRDQHKKKDRRSRVILQGSLAVLVVSVVVVVGLVITNSVRPPSPGPKNMLSDGIKIGQGFKAASTPALQPDAQTVPFTTNAPNVIDLRIYVDYQCVLCGDFARTNAVQMKNWISVGAATLEIHPLAILDPASLGKKYSTRSANAAACVANYSPNRFFDFNELLFANQPKENTEGLTDARIISLTKKAKVEKADDVAECVTDQKFKSWVNAATARATSDPLAGTTLKKLARTPTVIINGKKYDGPLNSARDFATAVSQAAGDSFSQGTSATPSPSPTASPSN